MIRINHPHFIANVICFYLLKISILCRSSVFHVEKRANFRHVGSFMSNGST